MSNDNDNNEFDFCLPQNHSSVRAEKTATMKK